jgi:hypothetical protein
LLRASSKQQQRRRASAARGAACAPAADMPTALVLQLHWVRLIIASCEGASAPE